MPSSGTISFSQRMVFGEKEAFTKGFWQTKRRKKSCMERQEEVKRRYLCWEKGRESHWNINVSGVVEKANKKQTATTTNNYRGRRCMKRIIWSREKRYRTAVFSRGISGHHTEFTHQETARWARENGKSRRRVITHQSTWMQVKQICVGL